MTQAIDTSRLEEYGPDMLSMRKTLLSLCGALFGGGAFSLICWYLLKTTSLPAFGPSMVTRAISTLGSVIVLAVVAFLVIAWVMDEKRKQPHPRWRVWLTYLTCYLAPAGLVVTTIAVPLSATRLYLDGITVDQGFRTQFFTRLTDSTQLSDMNYIDMPTFYPGFWFWFGGRFSNLLGMPGWEGFQPWAIVSLSMSASLLVPLWQRLCGSLPVATGIALASTCVALVMSAEEPYAAVIALGVPAASILTYRALVGSRFSMVGMIIYLGISASSYTLYTALVALSVIFIAALVSAVLLKSFKPIIRLTIMGVCSLAFAAIWWAPYFSAVIRGGHTSGATASHYLPLEGAQIPLPMLSPSIVGLVCLIGLIYLIVRVQDLDVRMLGIGLLVVYAWVGLSMAFTLIGTTLLGFRLDVVIALQLVTAGVLGLAELRIYSIHKLFPDTFDIKTSRTINFAFMAVLIAGGISYAQSIPSSLSTSFEHAYSDTDGYGERADRYPPNSTQYYQAMSDYIQQQTGKAPRDTVVMTDEQDFMSFHPYRGFQAFTSHYANPLGEFDLRNEAITQWALDSWSDAKTPAKFVEKLEQEPWKSPEVFIFRGSLSEAKDDLENNRPHTGWVYDLAEDIYPNNPNVRFRGVRFNSEVFMGEPWTTKQFGPFVVVTRS